MFICLQGKHGGIKGGHGPPGGLEGGTERLCLSIPAHQISPNGAPRTALNLAPICIALILGYTIHGYPNTTISQKLG
jgi:hypothetical protein